MDKYKKSFGSIKDNLGRRRSARIKLNKYIGGVEQEEEESKQEQKLLERTQNQPSVINNLIKQNLDICETITKNALFCPKLKPEHKENCAQYCSNNISKWFFSLFKEEVNGKLEARIPQIILIDPETKEPTKIKITGAVLSVSLMLEEGNQEFRFAIKTRENTTFDKWVGYSHMTKPNTWYIFSKRKNRQVEMERSWEFKRFLKLIRTISKEPGDDITLHYGLYHNQDEIAERIFKAFPRSDESKENKIEVDIPLTQHTVYLVDQKNQPYLTTYYNEYSGVRQVGKGTIIIKLVIPF